MIGMEYLYLLTGGSLYEGVKQDIRRRYYCSGH